MIIQRVLIIILLVSTVFSLTVATAHSDNIVQLPQFLHFKSTDSTTTLYPIVPPEIICRSSFNPSNYYFSWGNSLARFSAESFLTEFFSHPQLNRIIAVQSSGEYCVVLDDSEEIYLLNENLGTFSHLSSLSGIQFFKIDSTGGMYLVTNTGELKYVSLKNQEPELAIKFSEIKQIELINNQLYIIDQGWNLFNWKLNSNHPNTALQKIANLSMFSPVRLMPNSLTSDSIIPVIHGSDQPGWFDVVHNKMITLTSRRTVNFSRIDAAFASDDSIYVVGVSSSGSGFNLPELYQFSLDQNPVFTIISKFNNSRIIQGIHAISFDNDSIMLSYRQTETPDLFQPGRTAIAWFSHRKHRYYWNQNLLFKQLNTSVFEPVSQQLILAVDNGDLISFNTSGQISGLIPPPRSPEQFYRTSKLLIDYKSPKILWHLLKVKSQSMDSSLIVQYDLKSSSDSQEVILSHQRELMFHPLKQIYNSSGVLFALTETGQIFSIDKSNFEYQRLQMLTEPVSNNAEYIWFGTRGFKKSDSSWLHLEPPAFISLPFEINLISQIGHHVWYAGTSEFEIDQRVHSFQILYRYSLKERKWQDYSQIPQTIGQITQIFSDEEENPNFISSDSNFQIYTLTSSNTIKSHQPLNLDKSNQISRLLLFNSIVDCLFNDSVDWKLLDTSGDNQIFIFDRGIVHLNNTPQNK